MTGIYGIRNRNNGKTYVGQSVDTDARYARHLRELKKGVHYNKHLQRSFNKHGEDQFELLLLEECEKENLAEKEQKWIDKYSKKVLYNQQLEVYDLQGERNPFFGKSHTDKSKRKMSEWKKENYNGSDNPNFGKKNSIDTLVKMSEGRSNKLKEKDVLEITRHLREGRSHQEIADLFDIGRTVVTRISNGTRWTNVTGGPVIPIVYKDGVRQFSKLHRQRIGEKRKGIKHTEETKQLMSKKAMRRGER